MPSKSIVGGLAAAVLAITPNIAAGASTRHQCGNFGTATASHGITVNVSCKTGSQVLHWYENAVSKKKKFDLTVHGWSCNTPSGSVKSTCTKGSKKVSWKNTG